MATTMIVGKKIGMTRVFTEDGVSVPVTVVECQPNIVTQTKTVDNDGYTAVQVASGKRRKVTKPVAGILKAAKASDCDQLNEFRLDQDAIDALKVGDQLTVARFEGCKYVDVTGTTKGKGFAGVIKRWNFSMQDATHGNSLAHRASGSIGQCQDPGRVFKGKKMAGQMGNKQRTAQSLELVRIDAERNLLLIKGAVPGAPGGEVIVAPAIKKAHPDMVAQTEQAEG